MENEKHYEQAWQSWLELQGAPEVRALSKGDYVAWLREVANEARTIAQEMDE